MSRPAARRERTLRTVSLVLAVALLPGCGGPEAGSARRGPGPGGRQQPLALTPDQELEVGREAYQEVLRKYAGRILPDDDPAVRRVRVVAARLIRAAGIRPLQREINLRLGGYRFEWAVNVVREPQVNAFSLPGGKMIVFTGILHVTENEDELAAVLGHEIAHVLAHHVSERVARDKESGLWAYFRNKAYGRAQESEADHIGVFLMAFAGYDPEAAVRFWERMQQRSKNSEPPAILSDHPGDAQRIRDLRNWAPMARAAKRAFDQGRILKSP